MGAGAVPGVHVRISMRRVGGLTMLGKCVVAIALTVVVACGSVSKQSDTRTNTQSDGGAELDASMNAVTDARNSYSGFAPFEAGISADTSVEQCSVAEPNSCGPSCEALQDEARSLVDSFSTCDSSTTCAIVDMYALVPTTGCIGAFQCSQALRADDVETFRTTALSLAERYAECGTCFEGYCGKVCLQAECLDPRAFVGATCNLDTGRCGMVTAP